MGNGKLLRRSNFVGDSEAQAMYARNRNFSDKMLPVAVKLLTELSHPVVRTLQASEEDDSYYATDLTILVKPSVLQSSGKDLKSVGFRCRTVKVTQRDFTVRSQARNGLPTEWHKLKAGHADIYLYAWANAEETAFRDYMVIDLHRVRQVGLFDHMHAGRWNPDGTRWLYLTRDELYAAQAILAESWARQLELI